MTLKQKKKFFNRHWFWCQLHGFDKYHLGAINGNFLRYTKKCEIDARKSVWCLGL